MGSTMVGIRLGNNHWKRYSDEAATRGVPLATLLRTRLEQEDRLLAELDALRHVVERFAPESQRDPSAPSGALLEALILLRSLAGLQKTTIAQKEVERRGLETWR